MRGTLQPPARPTNPMTTLFDEAIATHLAWVTQFEQALSGIAAETFDSKRIGDDMGCSFGQWLHGNAALFPDPQHFDYVRSLHMVFHEVAAEIAALMRPPADSVAVQAKLVGLRDLSTHLVVVLRELKAEQAAGR
jgi:hypothetical protein